MSIGTTIYQSEEQKKRDKQAKKDAAEDRDRAIEAELFADEEGKGVGSVGNVFLNVDDDLDEERELRRKQNSPVRI